ncbi:MAG: hypothetical protein JWM95_3735 [Gemmatimonadetes bacterium]|nr:hypothetical protein [Gemmatimonadota bacterium]
MDDERTPDTPAPAPPRAKRRRWPYVLAAVVILLPMAVVTVWGEIALHWSYSKGIRPGFLQKFSQKGWICKTWEGELSMVNLAGQSQEKWAFTVRSDSLAQELNKVMGSHVSLAYEEHPGIPNSCYGDTRYFVTGLKVIP